jgi:hypothetical protein
MGAASRCSSGHRQPYTEEHRQHCGGTADGGVLGCASDIMVASGCLFLEGLHRWSLVVVLGVP